MLYDIFERFVHGTRFAGPRVPATIRSRSKLRKLAHSHGFTLIELMIVVLILAVLVAIVVTTYVVAAGNASSKAADYNMANGSKMMTKLWYDLSLKGKSSYADPGATAIGAQYMSRSGVNYGGQTSTKWARLTRYSSTNKMRVVGGYTKTTCWSRQPR